MGRTMGQQQQRIKQQQQHRQYFSIIL